MITHLKANEKYEFIVEKPCGWYWNVSWSWRPARWFKVSELDFRPAGEPLQELFFEMGPVVLLIGLRQCE